MDPALGSSTGHALAATQPTITKSKAPMIYYQLAQFLANIPIQTGALFQALLQAKWHASVPETVTLSAQGATASSSSHSV
ncbi:hypothetical protein VCV18_004564 [Metarhizium anisopliae]